VAWFPLAGALIGLLLGAVWWVAAEAWPAPVAAALVVAADLGLTGMLHFDGLLDSADGVLSHLAPERRLIVMAAPDVGAFAIAVGGAVLLTRFASLAALRPAPLLLAGVWCASRTLMAAVMRIVPYARMAEGGLATSFLGPQPTFPGPQPPLLGPQPPILGPQPPSPPSPREDRTGLVSIVAGGIGALVLAAAWRPLAGSLAIVVGTAAGIGVVLLARSKLGGFTGDVLGAAGVVAETVGLVVAAAKW
jgi:cobalamin synthase